MIIVTISQALDFYDCESHRIIKKKSLFDFYLIKLITSGLVYIFF